MKVEIVGRKVIVDLRRNSFEMACATALVNAERPPDGYKLIGTTIVPRRRSGRAVNLEMIFVHCDPRVDPFTPAEAYAFFSDSPNADTIKEVVTKDSNRRAQGSPR